MFNKLTFHYILSGTLAFTLSAALFSYQDANSEEISSPYLSTRNAPVTKTPSSTELPSTKTNQGYEAKVIKSTSSTAESPIAKKITSVEETPQIQVAILLDTSSSMSGLINQTRTELWSVINALSDARKYNIQPQFNVALYEYGNDGLKTKNYIRKISSFTSDFDKISEHLFSLTTNGGSEYSGAVIDEASTDLIWSPTDEDLKVIFIAGNESFNQGSVPFQEAITKAKKEGIIINTIYCGNRDAGINDQWSDGATLGNGTFFSIDQNQTIAYIETPYDKQIAQYNLELNDTYLAYGVHGHSGSQRQKAEDQNSSANLGSYISRSISKSSSYYNNSRWDIIDASKESSFDLDAISNADLPAILQNKSKIEKEEIIQSYKVKRELIQKEMAVLKTKRQTYLAEQNTAKNTLGASIIKTLTKQAAQQGFVL